MSESNPKIEISMNDSQTGHQFHVLNPDAREEIQRSVEVIQSSNPDIKTYQNYKIRQKGQIVQKNPIK